MAIHPLSQSSEQSEACPGCGAQMVFNPALGQLACPYCQRTMPLSGPPAPVPEQAWNQGAGYDRTPMAALSQQALEVECPGCHATVTFEPPDVAGNCSFCNTHITTQPQAADPTITPGGVLPFTIDQKTARQRLAKWLQSRWFAPTSLKHLAQQEKIQGIYLPFWTFDCQTRTRYTGERGTYYYVTKQRQVKNDQGQFVTETYEDRKTRWEPVSGQVQRHFDDYLVPAVKSVKTNHLDQLEPWSLDRLVAYTPKYLQGFRAQRYQVSLEEGFAQAKQGMAPTIDGDICRDIGGDEKRILSQSTHYSQQSFKHVLLPVWMATYRFKNKPYQVLINGETGKIVGDRPYSVAKVVLAVGAAVVALFTISFLLGLFAEEPSPSPDPQSSQVVGPLL